MFAFLRSRRIKNGYGHWAIFFGCFALSVISHCWFGEGHPASEKSAQFIANNVRNKIKEQLANLIHVDRGR